MNETTTPTSPIAGDIDCKLYRERRQEMLACMREFQTERYEEGDDHAMRLPTEMMADAALMVAFAWEFGHTNGQLDQILVAAVPEDEAEEDTTQPSASLGVAQTDLGGGSGT